MGGRRIRRGPKNLRSAHPRSIKTATTLCETQKMRLGEDCNRNVPYRREAVAFPDVGMGNLDGRHSDMEKYRTT